ncbi:MAG: B12-binding domain-containing radical SAM protein, partial [Desulfobacterales bacterium]|nr:B12-binding domain-containing radical SAM protein [Desulfobacterales bacterium]
MRVLLVSANTEQINMPVLPLGLACVAAFIQEKGHDVKVVNLMMQKDTRIVIKEAITVFNPQVIGISVRNIDDQKLGSAHLLLDPVKEVVADCRDFSDVPIVLGGAGYSIFPQSTLEYLGADMGIQGEGEISFSKLLEHLENNE